MNLLAILTLLSCVAAAGDVAVSNLSVDEIVRRLVEMDKVRTSMLRGYIAERQYVAENRKFSKHAEVSVEESFAPPDQKTLKVVAEDGSPLVRRKVIDKLIEAELDATRDDNRDQTHVTSRNYSFRLSGTAQVDGYSCFVLEVTPKSAKKYLMRGQIWVDQEDFAIVRMEGNPAKNPSIWTRKVRFVRRYEKHGPFWLPASVESETEIVVAGTSTLKIRYSDYRIETRGELPASERIAPEPR
jgi:hypothetical protein